MALSLEKQMEMVAISLEMEREREFSSGGKDKLKELIAQGWRVAYTELYGQRFIDGLGAHHIEAIEWHWESRLAFLKGEYPIFDAYFPIWSRAHNKSGVARRIAVMDGFLSYAFGQPAFILYLSRNKEMVLKHAKSVATILKSRRVRILCPELSTVQTDDKKKSKGWTAAFFYTQANVIFQFSGLDEGLAGGNLETDVNEDSEDGEEIQSDVRVTLFVPDDVDGREDSPTIAEARFKTLTGEVLPMGQENSLVFFAQNLISRFSTMYRIYTQQERVLTGRKPTKPVPAVLDLKVEQRTTTGGIIQDTFISGTPTWHVWNEARIQREINRYGYSAFLRECQHEVEQSKEGLMHKKYNDNVHPISYSQFAAVYGSREAWKRWYKIPAGDYARTKTKYHANVAGFLAVSSQNSKLPGFTFLIPFSFKADTSPADVAVRLLSALTTIADPNTNKTWEMLMDEAWKQTNSHQHYQTESERIEFTKSYYVSLVAPHGRRVLSEYNVKTGVYSHSEDKVQAMLNEGFGFDFQPSNPKENDALEEIDEAMRVDYNLPHNFDPSKKGYTRWHVLCKDDLTKEPQIINGITVYPPVPYPEVMSPDELHDDDLFRYQMSNRRFAPPQLSKTGEKIDSPEKLNDDFGQMLQFCYLRGLLNNIELTPNELIEAQMSPQNSEENVAQYYGKEGFIEIMMARRAEERQIEIRMEEERQQQQDNLSGIFGGKRVRLLGRRRR